MDDLAKSVDTLGQGLEGIVQQANQQKGGATAANAGSKGDSSSADVMPCMQKLMPCQPYMHSPSPPPTCCTPLKDVIAQEPQCLCKVFNNPEFLKSANLTRDEALAIPKACGIDADVSVCNNGASPTIPSTPPGSATSNISSDSSTSSSANSNAGVRINEATAAAAAFWYIASIAAVLI
ncbi:hypothetical protein DITRI_Ditri04bG0204700 [Diplodiscus trichospermus]